MQADRCGCSVPFRPHPPRQSERLRAGAALLGAAEHELDETRRERRRLAGLSSAQLWRCTASEF
eukprot:1243338-Pleurochrysis_carterae.AAC.1